MGSPREAALTDGDAPESSAGVPVCPQRGTAASPAAVLAGGDGDGGDGDDGGDVELGGAEGPFSPPNSLGADGDVGGLRWLEGDGCHVQVQVLAMLAAKAPATR